MSQYVNVTLPLGLPGTISRGAFDHTVESHANSASTPVNEFGVAVAVKAGVASPATAAADVSGFSVRNFTQVNSAGEHSTDVVPVLVRGYILVKVTSGTAAAGGKVYVTDGGAISATGTTAVAGAFFMGAADASGVAEIKFNI